jgi:excinuclease ABC subunit C
LLDDIPGIGPATRKKLLREFGSMRGITKVSESELAKVLGVRKARTLKQHLINELT